MWIMYVRHQKTDLFSLHSGGIAEILYELKYNVNYTCFNRITPNFVFACIIYRIRRNYRTCSNKRTPPFFLKS